MIAFTTPEPTVRPPSRNHFTVWFTILSLIFLVFQRFCLQKACGILVTLRIGAILEPLANFIQTPCLNHRIFSDSCHQFYHMHVTCMLLACSLHVTHASYIQVVCKLPFFVFKYLSNNILIKIRTQIAAPNHPFYPSRPQPLLLAESRNFLQPVYRSLNSSLYTECQTFEILF